MYEDHRKVSGARGRLPGSRKETAASVLQMQELDSADNLNKPGSIFCPRAASKEYSGAHTLVLASLSV